MSVRLTTRAPFGFMDDLTGKAARAVCAEAGAEAERHVVEAMKTSGVNDTGGTMQGVQVSPVAEVRPRVYECIVAPAPTQVAVAQVLEVGRRPGRPVSKAGRAKIRVWIRRKAKALLEKFKMAERERRQGRKRAPGQKPLEEAALDAATFAVARAITLRGSRVAYGFYRRAAAYTQSRMAATWARVVRNLSATGGRR